MSSGIHTCWENSAEALVSRWLDALFEIIAPAAYELAGLTRGAQEAVGTRPVHFGVGPRVPRCAFRTDPSPPMGVTERDVDTLLDP